MTAAVSRWFLGLSGPDLLVGVAVIATLSVAAAYGLFKLGAWLWRKYCRTWHDRVTLKHGPIRFEDRFL